MPALSFKLEKRDMDVKTEIPTMIQPAVAVPVEKTVKAKWVVIGVVITTIVVVAGFVAAFCFMYQTSHAAIDSANVRFTGNGGKEVDEKIETYDDDTILYTLTDPEGHQSVIVEDYGRKLEVAKIRDDGRTVCYVTPLNKTRPLSNSIVTSQEENGPSEQVEYEASPDPVSDVSFLGRKAQEACKGAPVYWVFPKCAEEKSEDSQIGHRTKRAALPTGYRCLNGCCLSVCCCKLSAYSYRTSSGSIACRFICQRSGCSSNTIYYWRTC